MAPAFPVRTRQFIAEVGGAEASFVLSGYADRVMVVVTQVGTLGTIQQARESTLLDGKQTWEVATLLGKRDEPALTVCARHLAQSMAEAGCTQPLLLCLGLREHGLDGMRAIIREVLAHPVW